MRFHFNSCVDKDKMRIRSRSKLAVAFAAIAFIAVVGWCVVRGATTWRARRESAGDSTKVLVTGYCNCGKCCGWKRSWFGFGPAVYNYGSMKGRRKIVGQTASGVQAHRGTVAADLSVYPMGTRLVIPGYGEGVVEDVGGAINGRHIDVWFPTHREAQKWGARWLDVSRTGYEQRK